MKTFLLALALALTPATLAAAQAAPVPFPEQESLSYSVNWPSGLNLGEAEASATMLKGPDGTPTGWRFDFRIEASFPGYGIQDEFHSTATPELCSREFEKRLHHGAKRAHERTNFDQKRHVAKRMTLGGGGETEIKTGACAMDGLSFLYHLRRELSRGRIPPPRTVLFGAPYQVSLQLADTTKVRLHGKTIEADRLTVSVKGPASEITFLVEVARDAARTPVRITVPLEPGSFTMELAEQ